MQKTADAFRTISEVATELDLPQHVLRFWETRFTQIRPLKRGGGRRYYRREDVDLLRAIRHLLYSDGYTIKGVQKILKEQGARGVLVAWRDGDAATVPADELPVDVPFRRSAPPETVPSVVHPRSDDFDLMSADDEESLAFVPASHRSPAVDSSHYDVLKALLSEISECERLLGNARRPARV
jgi:DNA-binding transcriptional MerR regulator